MRELDPDLLASIDQALLNSISRRMIIAASKIFVDVKEEGNNKGYWIELLQKTADGKAQGESYCCSFVQSIIAYVELRMGRESEVFTTEKVMDMWRNTPSHLKRAEGETGDIAVWNHKGTDRGHCGIVIEALTDGFKCVEGNTNSGAAEFTQGNEGEGIYLKERPLDNVGTMELLGFISVY